MSGDRINRHPDDLRSVVPVRKPASGPMNPIELMCTRSRASAGNPRAHAAAAYALLLMLPWQTNTVRSTRSDASISFAAARRRGCSRRSGRWRAARAASRRLDVGPELIIVDVRETGDG